MHKTNKRLVVAIIAVLVYSVVMIGDMDHQDAVDMDLHYQEMVCAGHWPDYDNRRPDCAGATYPASGVRYEY